MSGAADKVLLELQKRIEKLALNIEKMKLAEYVHLLENPWKLFWINFINGIFRGLGIGVGFAVLGAFVIYVLKSLVTIPVIGSYIAQIDDNLSSESRKRHMFGQQVSFF